MKNMDTSSNKLSRIDMVRVIAALMIVAIHCFREETGFMNIYGAEFLGRWPVPFFFMVSGFFMKSKLIDVVKYCLRIFIMYLIWTLIYALVLGVKITKLWDLISNLRNGIIMPFWYFPSLIMCTIFVWAISRVIKSKKIVVAICAVLYIVALCGDTYKNVPAISNVMDTYFFPIFERIMGVHDTRDGIFNGSFFMSIGLLLKDMYAKGSLDKFRGSTKLYVATVILGLIYILEITINIKFGLGGLDVLLTSPYFAAAIFIVALFKQMEKKTALIFRGMSSLIYLMHYMFLTNIQEVTSNQWIWLLATASLSIVSSIIVIAVSKKIKILNYIY